jgi:hypothetical protein
MGTNYYLHKDYCPCCGHPKVEVHLGKSSGGWKFLFNKTRQVYNYETFCNFLKTGTIYDEYGNVRSEDYLLDLIQSKQLDQEHDDCEHIDGYDFLNCDFS